MDDTNIGMSSLKHANTSNNYILLLKKIDIDELLYVEEVSETVVDNEVNMLPAISQINLTMNSNKVDPVKNKFMSDEDLELRIIELENNDATPENKTELRKLKGRRRQRKHRENMNAIQREEKRTNHKELVKSIER